MGATVVVVGVSGVVGVNGVAAFPRSPLWHLFPQALMFIARGFSLVG